ncbi:MAG TPA: monovalent cation/H+ antiporter complex subunit F [Candidatus Sabulitectum sp.]|nr:monovalent cation/H+ antiporter complex subunit F [Candidatus Sabulitectum sp.]
MGSTFLTLIVALTGAGIVLSFLRLLLGPRATDRAVALDTTTLITTSLLVLIAVLEGRSMLLDVALVYSVLSFLGVLAMARYLDGGLK